ncbi:peptidylprolyl isomerase [Roseateles amylovorans]|uniref:Peptidyl-prolyl cis-trans isomerase n=1 Tax=Roseateles amylovorans TaxID=2978473 RepID=A0ABY6AZA5_9BURK|nr:peptidylprolyl isomerase [Roseateles amylovorans]UXH78509.1 peptidylprolyl isomerase [Roseateles amylovorans]
MSSSMILKRRVLALAAAVGGALLMTACGGGGDTPGAPTPVPNPKPTAPTTTCSAAGIAASTNSALPRTVCMLTSNGEIVIELDPAKAPITVANFLKYVNAKYYDNTIFHRVVPGFVAQGGGYTSGEVPKTGGGSPIKLETNVGLTNARGTIAMARTPVADSAVTEFYFNSVDNNVPGSSTNLDYVSANQPGYAVFGRIISGLGTLDAINAEKQLGTGGLDRPATEVVLYWAIQLK